LFELPIFIEKMVPRIGEPHEKSNYRHKKEQNRCPPTQGIDGFGIKKSHRQP